MSSKKCKGVLIVGKNTADNQIQRLNILIKAYEKEGFKVIGSAEKGFELSDLKILDGMIDNNTIIVITAHGSPRNERHVIKHSDKIIYTGYLLEILNSYGNGSPLNIILSSCYGGLASKEANILSRGAVFITHGLENKSIETELASHSLEQQLFQYNSYPSLFEGFINEFLTHSMQTSIISVAQGINMKHITFNVHPNLQEVIESPEKTLTNIQKGLIEFYASLNIKTNNIDTRELTAQEIIEFQKSYFIFNCLIGNTAIVELLNSNIESLELSNLVNSKLADTTPLFAAAQNGHLEIVKELLQHNADFDKAMNNGETPLFMAAQEGHFEVVKALLQYNADVEKARDTGATPLLVAAGKGYLEIVKALLQHNADVDKAMNIGATPLLIAAQNGHLEIAKTLLQHNADVDKAPNNGGTPLYIAAQEGYLEIVKALLQHNADVDKAPNDGATPLLIAAQNGHLEIVKALLQHNADVDKADEDGTTPLFMAAIQGHLETVKALLHNNADVDKAANDGATPLLIAAQNGHLEIVKALLQHNVDVDKAANDGSTPLFMAVQKGHLEIVKELLQHNADVDKVANNGATAITYAICFKKDAIAKELILHSNKIWNHQSNESKANIKSIEKYCPSELDYYYNLVEEVKSGHYEEL